MLLDSRDGNTAVWSGLLNNQQQSGTEDADIKRTHAPVSEGRGCLPKG